MASLYIATALERTNDHARVRLALEAAGHTITYDWTRHGSVQAEGTARIVAVARAECDGVRRADGVIVLLPGGRGTHCELGIALGAGVPVLVHAAEPHTLLDYGGRTCAFYLHPLVAHTFGDLADATPRIVAWAATLAPRRDHGVRMGGA